MCCGLAPILPAETYLAGGTALALSLGHRRSIDLDLFAPVFFDEEQLVQNLQAQPQVAGIERSAQTLHLTIGSIKVSVLGYRYPILFPMERFLDVPIADPRDIACMKITAIASRRTKRDFIDFHACCRRHGLHELLGLFQRKYAAASYSMAHILKSLTFFADAEKDPMPDMLVRLEWSEVQAFFRREAPRVL
jgi:nucleotidyltransferase AbiEii toxin of type IV toxin-antitoxin system